MSCISRLLSLQPKLVRSSEALAASRNNLRTLVKAMKPSIEHFEVWK